MSVRKETDNFVNNEEVKLADKNGSPCPLDSQEFAPLPRTQRTPRRAKSEKGLPADEALTRLARRYLEIQMKNWPKLVSAGLLTPATNELVAEMVQDFKLRHQSGKIEHAMLNPFRPIVGTLGGMYCRYSCDNSNDLSIDDQMAKILAKASAAGCFIPWCYVFCDYSVTGRDASRQGYSSYKTVLEHQETRIADTYIDDFTRASRDEIEWWRLASLSKRLGKGLLGASDGFNLSDPNSDIMITIFGLVSRLFLKGLKEKVKRGMQGAAGRGTCLGKPSLGFTRRVLRNKGGNAVYDSDGLPTYDICIDPATRDDRVRIYDLFVNKHLSSFEIARQFNAANVDDWNGWTDSGIKKLLGNPNSIGVFIWNRTRREFNSETGKWKVVRNPRSEWTVNYRPELALISLNLWRGARKKLAKMRRKSPLTNRDVSRNQISATTLFSGTLFCESCGTELKLVRSTEKYKQMGCTNSLMRGHNCKLTASKSVKVIEECLLSYLRDVLLTDATLEQIVDRTNQVLDEESQKSAIDTTPLKAKERLLTSRIAKIIRLVEDCEDQAQTSGYAKRINELERELHGVKLAIRNANVGNMQQPQPLKMENAKVYLENLRGLLTRDTAEAAAAIRTITGPIAVREEKASGQSRGARWIASFHPQWTEILNLFVSDGAGAAAKYPDLSDENLKVEVAIEKIPQYVTLAAEFKRLHSQGSSIGSLAAAHGICWKQAEEILHFANTGERPKSGSRKRTGDGQVMKYIEIAQQVAELKDQKLSFAKIAERLNVGLQTVKRAYDHARPEAVCQAAANSTTVNRGRYSHLSADIFASIRQKISEGGSDYQIAAAVGASRSTVRRVRKELEADERRTEAG
jgi:DNA invertase Pin-like site-specific DNA recombinase